MSHEEERMQRSAPFDMPGHLFDKYLIQPESRQQIDFLCQTCSIACSQHMQSKQV